MFKKILNIFSKKNKNPRGKDNLKLDQVVDNAIKKRKANIEEGDERNKLFNKIMEEARSELKSKIIILNEFLDKYNLQFRQPKKPLNEFDANLYGQDSTVVSELRGLERTIYFSIHFNSNDKKMYEDFKVGKIKFEYELFEEKSKMGFGGNLISTFDFDELIKVFVEYKAEELGLRIK